MGLLRLHMGLKQLKDRMIKSSTMSQVLCSTIVLEFFISFQNKTQRFHYMTLSSLSKYVVFVDPHQGITCCAICLPTTKAYVEFIGRKKARAYLQCIYCKVKQQIQRELSHTIKLRCACVDKWWLYTGPNLILLYSLKTYLFFETWKHLLESRGYLIHLFLFTFFRRASKYPLF